MSVSKKVLAFAAVTAVTAATAVPAMALENEFHGMFKFMGYQSNALSGGDTRVVVANPAHSGFFAEQRARIMYSAKANDNLKLVTHFELDTRFGGIATGYKGTTGNDSGNLDADQLTLETKNVYLDFNCPITGTNFKVGMQPWADAYQSLFLLADMTGVYATKKVDNFTGSLGWFRFDDNTIANAAATTGAGQLTSDLIVVDGKYAINKDMTAGATYYNVQNDTGVGLGPSRGFDELHMLGLNADLKFGDALVKPFAVYQFGELTNGDDISAYLFGATAKIKAGPGAVNLAAYYMSGDDTATGDSDAFQTISAATTYFNASNMWLLVRPGQAINTSTSVLGNDMTAGGRGTYGLFAGYEGTAGKVFYNANIGYMATTEERTNAGVKEDGSIGTEINAQVGYKLYDNLSVSAAAAYAFLGDGLSGTTDRIAGFGAADADDPYLFNVQVSYVF